MRLSYWLHDWRTRHLTAAEARIQAVQALPPLPESDRMQTTPKVRAKPKRIEDWKKRYIA